MFGIGPSSSCPRSAVFVPALAAILLLSAPGTARAGELDAALRGLNGASTLFGFDGGQTATAPEKDDLDSAGVQDWSAASEDEIERVWAADFHPETDRWTERNNRIKISLFGSGLFFGQNMRIAHDAGIGLRVAWEVPGFIGVRLDSVMVPWSRMEVRVPHPGTNDSKRHMDGLVDCTSLSVAIFNPELSSAPGLAMWAGFGVDLWYYNYADRGITQINQSIRWQSSFGSNWVFNANPGGNFFFDLQYRVADIFHVGFGIREHIVYAPQTERGEFYKINGHSQGFPHNRNQGLPFALSAVHEFQVNISVLF